MISGDPHHVRVRGSMAFFGMADLRVEPFSSVIPSASGVEGMISNVMGHRGVHYQVDRVALLFAPRHVPMACNEVRDFGDGTKPINTEKVRTLRTRGYLAGNKRRLVCPHEHRLARKMSDDTEVVYCNDCGYVDPVGGKWLTEEVSGVDMIISFRMLAAHEADLVKYTDMLTRRLRNRNFWRQVHLGLRELVARVDVVDDFAAVAYPDDASLVAHERGLRTVDYSADLGLSWYGTDWVDPRRPNYFAPLSIVKGVLSYPTWDEVRKLGIKREPQESN